jgi:SAM-dependent methyltransferase
MSSVQQLYGELWAGGSASLHEELQESLDPRGTEWLFELFAELGPRPGELVVDVGARDAGHAIRLVREHGVRAIALDPVALHEEYSRRAVAEAGLEDSVEVVRAGIEEMPIPDGAADWIWCRDVLGHVDQTRGIPECARILRRGGRMLAYVTLATDRLEPREAAELFRASALVPESMEPSHLERCADAAGLSLVSRTRLGGEWREQMIEAGTWDVSDELLRVSRLRRRQSELVERHGATAVASYLGTEIWGAYQLLGKLCPTVYVWERGV